MALACQGQDLTVFYGAPGENSQILPSLNIELMPLLSDPETEITKGITLHDCFSAGKFQFSADPLG